MKTEPELLENSGYTLLDRLDHKELVPFVQQYLFRRSFWPLFYLLFTLGSFVALAFHFFNAFFTNPEFEMRDALTKATLGFASAFLLIPLHEYIHAIAYRTCGAREVSYDADLKKLVFMAIAHRFVASSREFRFVAMAPFAFISLAAIAALPFLPGNYTFSALALVFTHAAFCGGDFAMLSYLDFHKGKAVVTWDDKVNKVTWFYGKPAV
ncbi:MAG: DUF3267 domain-containing protein [Bacteroidales bacterium]|jgi:hypothetical protein|nr:DUF3267 domain-containing protein [Bacteroidales bacterium]